MAFRAVWVSFSAAVVSLSFAAVASAQSFDIRIGVLAYRGKDHATGQWRPTAEYLSRKIPTYQFEIVPLNLVELKAAVKERAVDFVLTNPGHYVDLEAQFGVSRIATLKEIYHGRTYTRFGAVIFTRSRRAEIDSLKDLMGRSFMAVNREAFGGFRMAWGELKEQGIDPFRDFSRLEFSGFPQDLVVYAVRDGKVDAGTVRAHTLERMAREGRIKRSDFKILSRQPGPGLPFPHSTPLYPEWPFARLKSTPSDLSERVAIALLQLSPRDEASRAANIAGWTVPMDYQAVHDLYRSLRVGPYRNLGAVSLGAFAREHAHVVAAVGGVFLFLFAATVVMLRLDRRVRRSEASLAKAQKIARLGNWDWDVQRNKLSWSGQIYRIFGIESGSQVNFEAFIDRVHPEDRELVKAAVNNSLYHGRPFNVDHRIVTADGSTRVVNQQGEVEFDQEGVAARMTATVQDITRRKSDEERLRASEREVSSILRNMQDVFFRIDTHGRFVFVSDAVKDLLGYRPEELEGQSIAVHMPEREFRRRFLEQINSADAVTNFETRLVRKDGAGIWVAINAHMYRDEDGDLAGVEGTVRDVTALKRAQDSLYHEKEQMLITLESIGDAVMTTDVGGFVQYMNPVAENLTGCSLDQGRGRPLVEVSGLVDPASREALNRRFAGGLDAEGVERYVDHDALIQPESGDQRVVELTLTAIQDRDGRVTGAVAVFHDITEVRSSALQR